MFFKKERVKNNNFLTKVCALLIHAAKIDENYTDKEEEIDVGTRGGEARDGVGGTGVARVENGHQDDEIDSKRNDTEIFDAQSE